MTDTSTPADRTRFCALVDHGGGAFRAAAAAVENCNVRLPETTAALLNLPDGATFARAAEVMRMRWADGRAGH